MTHSLGDTQIVMWGLGVHPDVGDVLCIGVGVSGDLPASVQEVKTMLDVGYCRPLGLETPTRKMVCHLDKPFSP